MRIRKLNHSVYQTQYHIVWGTKYRRKVLKPYVRKDFVEAMYKVLKQHPDLYLFQLNTGEDHVHLRIEIPPNYAISEVVGKIKSCTSAHLRRKFNFIDNIYTKSGIWSVGYFVSTVGLNEEQIKKYIERQNKWDQGIDVSNEFS